MPSGCRIELIEISAAVMGRPATIFPVLIWDQDRAVLVDAGYPGQLSLLKEGIQKTGLPFDRLNEVVVTHHDIDHIGSLAALQNELSGRLTILAHKDEKAYIEGEKQPLKLAQLEANFTQLPAEMQEVYGKLKVAFENSRVQVDRTLVDGDELPLCGGITVIHTPGHTLGHICLYVKERKLLIAGDALAVENGNLAPSPAFTNYDMDLYRGSIKKLASFDIEAVACYHGGMFAGRANERLRAIASAG